MSNISKSFVNTLALSHIKRKATPDTILALLEENGTGKSTLIKNLAGVHKKNKVQVIYQGQEIENSSILKKNHFISFIHQDLELID